MDIAFVVEDLWNELQHYKVDNFLINQLEHGAKFADPPPLDFHWRSSPVIFRTMITI